MTKFKILAATLTVVIAAAIALFFWIGDDDLFG